MLHQRPSASSGCGQLSAVEKQASDAGTLCALRLRASMSLYGKFAPEALAAVLASHLDQPHRPHVPPVRAIAAMAEQHLAASYVERAPTKFPVEVYGAVDTWKLFGATFSSVFLLVDLQEAA